MTIEGIVEKIRKFAQGRRIDPGQDFDACTVRQTDKGVKVHLAIGGELFGSEPEGDREPLDFKGEVADLVTDTMDKFNKDAPKGHQLTVQRNVKVG